MWTLPDFAQTRWVEKHLGGIFMGKHGDDRNDGHPARPVASLARAVQLSRALGVPRAAGGGIVVVGSGVYSDVADINSITLIGDGFVTFDGQSAPYFDLGTGYAVETELRRLRVYNYMTLGAGQEASYVVRNCILNNVQCINREYFRTLSFTCSYSLLVNCFSNVMPVYAADYLLDNCTFIGTNLNLNARSPYDTVRYSSRVIRNSYFDAGCQLQFQRQNTAFNILNCNMECSIGYLSGNPNNGNAVETPMSLADFRFDSPARVINCVSLAPGFNNPAGNDYTLAPASSMANLAFDGGFAGAYGVGINFSGPADADQLTNALWSGQLQGFVLDNPAQPGLVEFGVKDFTRNWILNESLLVGEEDNVDHQTIDATISYETDGNGNPVNVPSGALTANYTYWVSGYDYVEYRGQRYTHGQFFPCQAGYLTYITSGAGKVVRLVEAPNIRLYEMKYSTVSAGDCISQPWQYFVFNKVPTVDAAGHSNGHPLFNPATANAITVRFVKLRLTLMPNSLA